jgi:hypothetical protein
MFLVSLDYPLLIAPSSSSNVYFFFSACINNLFNFGGTVVVVIVWQLNLQPSMQSVPITANIESSNPAQARCIRYNIVG